MSEDHDSPKPEGERGPKLPSEGAAVAGGPAGDMAGGPIGDIPEDLEGMVSGAAGDLASGLPPQVAGMASGLAGGSPQQMATAALGKLPSLAANPLGSALGPLGVRAEVASAGMGLASNVAQQGLGSAASLVAGLIGKQALPKVEYTLDVSDGPDVLWQVRRMHLSEALSEPYALTLDLVTEDVAADTDAMLGASIELQITRDVLVRRVCGLIHQVEYIGVAHDRLQIRVKIGPALHLLNHRVDTRLWQLITVPDVIKEVLEAAFSDYGRTLKIDGLTATYDPREYIVQYRECDLDFVHRLMEEEGITYWFDHVLGKGKEVMVLEDSNDNYVDVETIDEDPGLRIIADRADNAEVESVQRFGWSRDLTATAVEQRIFDWLDPENPVLVKGSAAGGTDTDERKFVRQVYHHGHFAEFDAQPRTVRKLMHLRQRDKLAHGLGIVTGLFPGCKFAIADHPRADLEQEYLIRRITHIGDCPEVLQGEGPSDSPRYQNNFECWVFDSADPYRPPNVTARPRIYGPQTAFVTGPKDAEIHTDEHGRVKVLFHWDRVNKGAEDTSMWIRVAHHWAGPGYGTFFVPRIGMEVVVEFLEGDPAKPLINGCVYNGVNKISVGPAENMTQSTIRTRSSPDSEGYNEIMFEDLAGSEKIVLHAQKDLNETVENSHSTTVKGGQSNSVGGDQSNTVSGKQTETVTGETTLTYKDKRTVTVTKDQSVTVEGDLNKLDIPTGKYTVDVGQSIDVTAETHIKFKCGGAIIEMTTDKIELSVGGSRVKLMAGLAEIVSSTGALVWLTDTAKMKSNDGSYVYLADHVLASASTGALAHLTANVFLQSSEKSVVCLGANAEMTGAAEASVASATKTTLGAGGTVEATPAGVAVSGGKIDVTASGVATLAGGVVKIN
jgi:type VI secretion system secreted protein VgrG